MSAWLSSDHIIALCTPFPHTHTYKGDCTSRERVVKHTQGVDTQTHGHQRTHLKPRYILHPHTDSHCSIWHEADRSYMQVCLRAHTHTCIPQKLPPAHPHIQHVEEWVWWRHRHAERKGWERRRLKKILSRVTGGNTLKPTLTNSFKNWFSVVFLLLVFLSICLHNAHGEDFMWLSHCVGGLEDVLASICLTVLH